MSIKTLPQLPFHLMGEGNMLSKKYESAYSFPVLILTSHTWTRIAFSSKHGPILKLPENETDSFFSS